MNYNKRSVTSKVVQQQDEWSFELGVGQGTDLPFYVLVGFQRKDRLTNQSFYFDSFYRPANAFSH